MNPLERYRQQIDQAGIQPDPEQARIVTCLQDLHDRLIQPQPTAPRGLFARFRKHRPEPISGIYLWGGVGRGKTWLMDLFFHGLPLADKQRLHFHRFMHGIHRQLDSLKGQPDPLKKVAAELAAQTRVLCLDEFQVWDIGDAMILGGLLEALFEHGLCLVATSNSPPAELYPNGLQRVRFLPAIERLETHTQVVELTSSTDYRQRALEQAGTYHTPLNPASEQALAAAFEKIAPEPAGCGMSLEINGRPMPVLRHADSLVWIDFHTLCEQPRSQSDYLELARCYHSLVLSGIPLMNEQQNDKAKRFIHLVDVLYDHNVSLIASAAAQPEDLYSGRSLAFEFRRTASRLREMQSSEWLDRPHLGQ